MKKLRTRGWKGKREVREFHSSSKIRVSTQNTITNISKMRSSSTLSKIFIGTQQRKENFLARERKKKKKQKQWNINCSIPSKDFHNQRKFEKKRKKKEKEEEEHTSRRIELLISEECPTTEPEARIVFVRMRAPCLMFVLSQIRHGPVFGEWGKEDVIKREKERERERKKRKEEKRREKKRKEKRKTLNQNIRRNNNIFANINKMRRFKQNRRMKEIFWELIWSSKVLLLLLVLLLYKR